jgi:hypothetical protein
MGANIQTYATQAGRINIVKGETLAHAVPVEVLALGCTMKQMPKNSGDNVIYRRWLPYGAATTNANTINRWTVTPRRTSPRKASRRPRTRSPRRT